eukprot:CAMPEP_0172737688 /NCGR_PEP_ID=MMETSP1074-20121228/118314_1 /TAXON_ID=2916 /ORGANISM="Ceratium fusus, Strain PA161109" /LENGTH=100 /DNA_ID=CAMNT_0013567151 /DNA_START=24 /DNA_END=326 /DNA_ORIENTATION=-
MADKAGFAGGPPPASALPCTCCSETPGWQSSNSSSPLLILVATGDGVHDFAVCIAKNCRETGSVAASRRLSPSITAPAESAALPTSLDSLPSSSTATGDS